MVNITALKGLRLKQGFTLAEVLITLGIIGIVVAMTLPAIITNYQKKVTVEKVKTTYSILSTAINNSKNDHGDISNWDTTLSDAEFAKRYILPYLKITQVAKSKIDLYPLRTLSTQGGSSSNYLYWTTNLQSAPIYILSNGSYFVHKYQANELWIVVDINGRQKPNVMGIDGFSFNIDPKTNQLVPTGFGESRNNLKSNKLACVRDASWQYYRGGNCAALMMMDGWTISKDYTWGNGGLTPIP